MNSIVDSQVWELVNLPPKCKSIGNKKVLKLKCQVDESIDNDKAQLVVKG